MAYRRQGPTDPTRRFPWIALALGLLVVAVIGAFFLLNRPRTVNLTAEATPSVSPAAQAQSPQAGPPPTFTPPPAVLPATDTPLPTPTRVPVAPSPSGFVPGPGNPSTPAPAAAAAPTEPGSSTALPAAPPGQAPGAAGQPAQAAPATPTPAPPTPTPFAGQVGPAGGLGNTRQDIDGAYGAPAGQTPDQLVVYRKNNVEYHVGFTPDPPRAWLIAEQVPQGTQMTPEQASPEARKLFPRDAQPRSSQPEGNNQFVVERFASQTLGQAIPADQFQQRSGNPGDFLAVYARDPAQAGRITRIIVGIGDDPNVLLAAR
jgi:hypothetical protein